MTVRPPLLRCCTGRERSGAEVYANLADFAVPIPETLWSELSQAALICLGT